MALDPNINTREFQKFCELPNSGETAVRICTESADPIDVAGIDEVSISAPTGPFKITTSSVSSTAANPLASNLTDRVSLSIRNKGPETIYFGTSGVTADDTSTGGWEIGPNEDFNIDLDDSNNFFLIVASGTSTVKILEIAST